MWSTSVFIVFEKNSENLSTDDACEMSKKSIFYGPDFSICFRNMNPTNNQTYNWNVFKLAGSNIELEFPLVRKSRKTEFAIFWSM